jgi:hypothetical protein
MERQGKKNFDGQPNHPTHRKVPRLGHNVGSHSIAMVEELQATVES